MRRISILVLVYLSLALGFSSQAYGFRYCPPEDYTCQIDPVCTTQYDPVCAISPGQPDNPRTFSNLCKANIAGYFNILHKGQCDEIEICTSQYDPVCAATYANPNNQRTFSNSCVAQREGFTNILYKGQCAEIEVCKYGYERVCGRLLTSCPPPPPGRQSDPSYCWNVKEFSNRCEVEKSGYASFMNYGSCPARPAIQCDNGYKVNDAGSGCDLVCQNGYRANHANTVCEPIPSVCPYGDQPACGRLLTPCPPPPPGRQGDPSYCWNVQQFPNRCAIEQSGYASFMNYGSCPARPAIQCDSGYKPNDAGSDCVLDKPDVCSTVYAPVCGLSKIQCPSTAGCGIPPRTFSNACEAEKADHFVISQGACQVDPVCRAGTILRNGRCVIDRNAGRKRFCEMRRMRWVNNRCVR